MIEPALWNFLGLFHILICSHGRTYGLVVRAPGRFPGGAGSNPPGLILVSPNQKPTHPRAYPTVGLYLPILLKNPFFFPKSHKFPNMGLGHWKSLNIFEIEIDSYWGPHFYRFINGPHSHRHPLLISSDTISITVNHMLLSYQYSTCSNVITWVVLQNVNMVPILWK